MPDLFPCREAARKDVAELLDDGIVKHHDLITPALFTRLPGKAAPREAQGECRMTVCAIFANFYAYIYILMFPYT